MSVVLIPNVAVRTAEVEVIKSTFSLVDFLIDVRRAGLCSAPSVDVIDLKYAPVHLTATNAPPTQEVNDIVTNDEATGSTVRAKVFPLPLVVCVVAAASTAIELVRLGVRKHLPTLAADGHNRTTRPIPAVECPLLTGHYAPLSGRPLGLKADAAALTGHC